MDPSITNFDLPAYRHREEVVQIARDLVAGYRGDYYFFPLTASQYCLLTDFEEVIFQNGTLSASSARAYKISVGTAAGIPIYSYSVLDTQTPPEKTGSGSIYSNDVVSFEVSSETGIQITNTHNTLVYGSFDGLPHLQPGGDMYAYAGIFLGCTVCVFCLVDIIFRRIDGRSR